MDADAPRPRRPRRGPSKLLCAVAVVLAGLFALPGDAIRADITRATRPLHYVGINMSGAEYPTKSLIAWHTHETYPDARAIDYFADHGMNMIRLAIGWERLQPALCAPLVPESLARLDAVIDLARARHLTTLIDLHEYGQAFGKPIAGDSRESRCLADFWGRMAAHYRGRKDIWLGLMNEPHGQSAAEWLPAINFSLAAIRAAGFRGRVLVAGTYWGGVGNWVNNDNATVIGDHIVDPGHNYVIELHHYFNWWTGPAADQRAKDPNAGPGQFAPVTRWARDHKVRLFLGEIGVNSDPVSLAALDNTLSYMERNTDVWDGVAYYAFGGGPAPFSVYIDKPEPSVQMQVMMRHLPRRAATPPPPPAATPRP